MYITFYNKDNTKSYTIRPSQHCEKKDTHIWIYNEEGEGAQFNADNAAAYIYDALDKYFKENY